MSDFAGMEDLLQDFLVEAGDLLSGVDNKLVDLERTRATGLAQRHLSRFSTIKGWRRLPQRDRAGFPVSPHREPLRQAAQRRTGDHPEVMDVILMFSTAAVRHVRQPRAGRAAGAGGPRA